jgi:hypothetical protein
LQKNVKNVLRRKNKAPRRAVCPREEHVPLQGATFHQSLAPRGYRRDAQELDETYHKVGGCRRGPHAFDDWLDAIEREPESSFACHPMDVG